MGSLERHKSAPLSRKAGSLRLETIYNLSDFTLDAPGQISVKDSVGMGIYHPDIPGGGPPAEAKPVEGSVFRGIKSPPISPKCFLSEVELGNGRADRQNPNHWGLSCWQTEEAVSNARDAFQWMKKWHVAVGDLNKNHGVILETGEQHHPGHCTWWKPLKYDPTPDFKIALMPIN